ncbi:MAG: hypothetical protein ACHQPI_07290 [Thermoanaerobaculia bacterium]
MPRPFGTDHLDVAPEGRLVLHAVHSKGWRGRGTATQTAPAHPGTAIHWEEELWEVVSALDLPGGGARYGLARWDERHAARLVVRYDETSEQRLAEGRRSDRHRSRGWVRALVLSPFYGLLPAPAQHRIEDETAFPATVLTVVSALIGFFYGMVSLISILSASMGGASILPMWAAIPGIYFLVESGARGAVAIAQGRPVGSILGEVVWTLLGKRESVPVVEREEEPGEELYDAYRLREPFFALLPESDQRLAAECYGFDFLRWGRVTAFVLLGALGPMALVTAATLLVAPSPGDVLLLLLSVPVAVEQISRLARLRKGEPAPSLLRVVARPFCATLLEKARPQG